MKCQLDYGPVAFRFMSHYPICFNFWLLSLSTLIVFFFLLQGAKEEAKTEETEKEKLCELKQHKKIIDKGKPDDVMPGRKSVNVSVGRVRSKIWFNPRPVTGVIRFNPVIFSELDARLLGVGTVLKFSTTYVATFPPLGIFCCVASGHEALTSSETDL